MNRPSPFRRSKRSEPSGCFGRIKEGEALCLGEQQEVAAWNSAAAEGVSQAQEGWQGPLKPKNEH